MKKGNLQLSFGLVLVVILLLTWCSSLGLNAMPSDHNNAGKSSQDAGFNLKTINLNKETSWPMLSGVTTNYVKLDDINPEAVPEIKLDFNIDDSSFIVKETKDGLLCGYMIKPMISAVTKYPKSMVRIRKLDKAGNLVWDKEYGDATFSGKINNLLVYPDGSYLFTIQTFPYYSDNNLIVEKSRIIKCDQNGVELWRREFNDDPGDMLRHLFLTGDDQVIAVGQWHGKNGRQTNDGPYDIVITKLDKDGHVIQQKGFGGNDFENLRLAQYDKKYGIIINGTTTSRDGDFGIREDRPHADFVACIDESLTFQWIAHTKEEEHFVYDQLALANGFIYVLGHDPSEVDLPATAGFLIQLDKRGNMVWKKPELYTGLWGRILFVLENGDIVIASGQQNQGIMLILDKNGQEKQILEDLKFTANGITPTDDGGFIVTAIREIKNIPQPAYVSSIWYDTELVAVKYRNDYTVEWRKTYDRHKDIMGLDYVFPLRNGKVIVE